MTTWADYIRGLESQTMGGRLGSYLQQLDVGPLGYMNPAVRATARNWFDPMSSRYLLAAAPGTMGGYWGWQTGAETAGQPTGSTFAEYLGAPLRYGQQDGGEFGYAAAPTDRDVGTGAGYLQAFRPWTREQWGERLGQLGLWDKPTVAQEAAGGRGTAITAADLTDVQRDYLGMLTMPETQSMIGAATMTGMNPIAQRAYRPGLSRAMSAWQMANPELGAGELLRQFATGTFTDPLRTTPYMPGVNVPATTGPTTFL